MCADKLHEHDLPAEVECGDQPIVSTRDIKADAETAIPLEPWYRLVKAANWTSMNDFRIRFQSELNQLAREGLGFVLQQLFD
jgi:hypothetical protein